MRPLRGFQLIFAIALVLIGILFAHSGRMQAQTPGGTALPEEEATSVTPTLTVKPSATPSATRTATTTVTSTVASTVTSTAASTVTVIATVTGTVTGTVTTPITATVLVPSLNLRAGPGTTYARLGAAVRNEALTVVGALPECGWLRVTSARGVEAWVSGDARYVTLSAPCAEVAQIAAESIATPTRAATATRAAAATTAAAATATSAPAATATPLPTAAPTVEPPVDPTGTPEAEDEGDDDSAGPGFPEGQGCVRVGNYIGPELTVTFTQLSSGQSFQSTVPNNQTRIYCLNPGRYTVTADAPPPWSNTNFEMEIRAGEGIDLPFVPQ